MSNIEPKKEEKTDARGQKLLAAVLNGVKKYRTERFVSDTKVHPENEKAPSMHSKFFSTSGEEGLQRSFKIEAFAKEIGTNECNALMLVYAIINNPEGSTLRDYAIKAITEENIFSEAELKAKEAALFVAQLPKLENSDGSTNWGALYAYGMSVARSRGGPPLLPEVSTQSTISALVEDALRRAGTYSDTRTRISAIWTQLNDKTKLPKDISMEPFQKEMATIAAKKASL